MFVHDYCCLWKKSFYHFKDNIIKYTFPKQDMQTQNNIFSTGKLLYTKYRHYIFINYCIDTIIALHMWPLLVNSKASLEKAWHNCLLNQTAYCT